MRTILTLCIHIAVYVDIADIQPIALSDFTIDFQVLPFYELDYPYTYITDSDFFKKMTGWTFQFLDARRHEVRRRAYLVILWRKNSLTPSAIVYRKDGRRATFKFCAQTHSHSVKTWLFC